MSKAECSYVRQALTASSPVRADGRTLLDYRTVSLARGIIPLANGSARVAIGGTEVLASAKLEVTDSPRASISCNVICPGSAYPNLAPSALDDLAGDYTHVLNATFADASLIPDNLSIIPGKKNWALVLDLVVFSDAGNIYDVLFAAARTALVDTRVPRTSPIEYRAPKGASASSMGPGLGMGFTVKREAPAVDFEIKDTWDEGAQLAGADAWPVCVTLNLVPTVHFLDATLLEEAAAPHRMLFMFSFPKKSEAKLHGMRLLGPGELSMSQIHTLLSDGQNYAQKLAQALDAQLKLQDLSLDTTPSAVYTLR
ncbi:ribosomal protein S5 domain 2-like protein [Exidia glandulosa HHB12029]|uniref:Ribosomal RNA-processing protein 42 n=1 Tax=Exidia glandulosa HHB12029 TaxID=1314781 RepID=A0A165PSS5_EXIGL|nr:ribosomal protein S5 domain 2-like protein [Exidia glandulosa HHB12029]